MAIFHMQKAFAVIWMMQCRIFHLESNDLRVNMQGCKDPSPNTPAGYRLRKPSIRTFWWIECCSQSVEWCAWQCIFMTAKSLKEWNIWAYRRVILPKGALQPNFKLNKERECLREIPHHWLQYFHPDIKADVQNVWSVASANIHCASCFNHRCVCQLWK